MYTHTYARERHFVWLIIYKYGDKYRAKKVILYYIRLRMQNLRIKIKKDEKNVKMQNLKVIIITSVNFIRQGPRKILIIIDTINLECNNK